MMTSQIAKQITLGHDLLPIFFFFLVDFFSFGSRKFGVL
jgi:hypothetical protein